MWSGFRFSGRQGLWITGLLGILLIGLRFPDLALRPNEGLIEPWGDAVKNYTTVWYHVAHDSTYGAFSGMNYPYGDHIVLVDGQPLIANSLKWLNDRLPGLSDYTIGVIHYGMLLSLLGSVLLLYVLLLRLGLPVAAAGIIALGLTFLSPQLLRMEAHFGLAQVAAMPAVMLLLWKFDHRPGWRVSAGIGIVILFFALIHLYFLLLLGGSVFAFLLVRFLERSAWKKVLWYASHAILQLVIPAGLLFWWIKTTDPVAGRNDFPFGFFAYRAYPEGLFTSLAMPWWQVFTEHLIQIRRLDLEARNYLGLTGSVVFLLLLFRWVHARFSFQVIPSEMEAAGFLHRLFWSAFLILLFACGLPFILPGLAGLLDYTGPIRQFRSIGRFAWYGYFALNLVAFAYLFHWAQKAWTIRRWVWGGALAFLCLEAFLFVTNLDLKQEEWPQLPNNARLTELPVDYEAYQACLTVPHYNVGSGNFWWPPEGFIIHFSTMLSVQTGVPTTSSMLTRTNLDQAFDQLQLATRPYRIPRILDDLPDSRPLLLLWDEQEARRRPQLYAHLREDQRILYDGGRLKLYELPLTAFREHLNNRIRRIREEKDRLDSVLVAHGRIWSADTLMDFVYQPFDTSTSERAYLGGNAWEQPVRQLQTLYDGPVPAMADDSAYVVSFWAYLREPLAARAFLEIVEYDPESGRELAASSEQLHHWPETFDPRGWALIRIPWARRQSDSFLRLRLRNPDMRRRPLTVDELLIHPQDARLFMENDTMIWRNNEYFVK